MSEKSISIPAATCDATSPTFDQVERQVSSVDVDGQPSSLACPAKKPSPQPVALSHEIRSMSVGNLPVKCEVLKTYGETRDLLTAFAEGRFSLVIIISSPGLGKSQMIRHLLNDQQAMIVKLRESPLQLYIDFYKGRDKAVVLDDADNLLAQPLCRQYVRALTETDAIRRISYGTTTTVLPKRRIPLEFKTSSPVCILANRWDHNDSVSAAIASRAEIFRFEPNWSEVYREMGTWFWDQEIYDYIQGRLLFLKEPDMRLCVKAYNRKMAGLQGFPWHEIIDAHVDDRLGLAVRRLMADSAYSTNEARAAAFSEGTQASRATFYRRLKDIRRYYTAQTPARILLRHTTPPNESC